MISTYKKLDTYLKNNPVHHGAFRLYMDVKDEMRCVVFDFSCGGTAMALAKHVQDLICVCPNFDEARVALSRLREAGRTKSVSVLVATPFSLPFKDRIFELVCIHKYRFNPTERIKKRFSAAKELLFNIERLAVDTGNIYISYYLPVDTIFGKAVFALLNIIAPPKADRFCPSDLLYYYETFNTAHFLKSCPLKAKKISSSNFFRFKRSLKGDNEGILFGPISKDAKYNYNFLKRLKDRLERQTGTILIEPDLIRIGSNEVITADYGSAIVRLPQSSLGLEYCRRNYQTLKNLEESKFGFTHPVPIAEGTLGNQNYFAESKIDGLSADLNRSAIGKKVIVREAFRYISDNTEIRTGQLSVPKARCLYENERRKLVPFLTDEDARSVNTLIEMITGNIMWEHVPSVLSHGDYKSSNFIFTNGTKKAIAGIIDWDMAQMEGLPFVDLLTLLVDPDELNEQNFVKQVWKIAESAADNQYMLNYKELLGLTDNLVKPAAFYLMLRYINSAFWFDGIKEDPVWYRRMISGSLIPAISRYLKETSRNV